jgi:lipopolysaccharide biosynthesis regulator YciM
MSDSYVPLLVGLIALLAGLAIGKAWERYKLRDGRWIDRRKTRQSPHYIIGLNYLVSNQIDLAIEELGHAARVDPDALEIHLILGNLYREKGQVGRAINVHQSLLQRPRLTPLAHAHVLLCLGLDYRRGGFVDRALEAFKEVLRLDPSNRYALANLQKLHEEQHQWAEAYQLREQLARLEDADGEPSRSTPMILAFLENELGLEAERRGDTAEAARRFEAAIEREPGTVPAYLNLGELRERQGDMAHAAATWERMVEVTPARAYLAFERLKRAYGALQSTDRFAAICRQLIASNPQDWRARLALAGDLADRGASDEALELLFEALSHNPHSLLVHQAIWTLLASMGSPPALITRYLALTRESVFYLDPHICTRCRYRSTELLWQCPQCHEWNTFVEERYATARDEEGSG